MEAILISSGYKTYPFHRILRCLFQESHIPPLDDFNPVITRITTPHNEGFTSIHDLAEEVQLHARNDLNPISREISFQKYILHCTNRQLGKEKLEVIAYFKINIYIFETNDSKARDFDKREVVIGLHLLLHQKLRESIVQMGIH
ncbi:MAG: hypothetical protein HXS47_02970 [Theionarchaea archaeon]|nr:hypothetical protein [Theionarchaea archaeon]